MTGQDWRKNNQNNIKKTKHIVIKKIRTKLNIKNK
jgi:hypothetical protein